MTSGLRTNRWLLALATVLGTGALGGVGAVGARAAAPLTDSFDLGRGKSGEFCEARRAPNDPAVPGLFNAGYTVRCRGWTDSLWVGQLFGYQDAKSAASFAKTRDSRLICGSPGPVSIEGLSKVTGQRCRDRESGLNAIALSVPGRRGSSQAAMGIEAFAGNLATGLHTLSGSATAKPLTVDVAALAPPPPRTDSEGAGLASGTGFDRQDVRTYSARGQFGDSRELANTYLSKLPADASIADKIDLRLDAALSESNLAYSDASALLLADAATLLASPNAPVGPVSDQLRMKYQVYLANDSLNRRDYARALAEADAAISARFGGGSSSDVVADPLADPLTLRRLNAPRINGAGGISVNDAAASREAQLRALAYFVRGGALAGLGQPEAADTALANAESALTGSGLSSVETVKLSWLTSSIAAERARLAEQRGDLKSAAGQFERSVAALEATSLYRDSPLLAQRRIGRANFLRRTGDTVGARTEFAAAMTVLEAAGSSAASGVTGLDGYFELLAAESTKGGDPGNSAAAAFFRTAQFINPPALTAQIAAMKKIYESGDSAGAARARALEDLARERRALATRISGLPAGADSDRVQLQAELAAAERRSAEVTSELAGDAQYLRANDSAVELAEIQAALYPKEALLKIVWLPRKSYAIVVTRDAAKVYPLGKTSAEISEAVAKVRTSIDGDRTPQGVVLTDFDVDSARALDAALIDPAAPLLDGANALIIDAAGPFNQLPLAILIRDDDSINRFNITARTNALDYTGIKFLGGAYDLSTTVSPRAFLVARQQPASKGSRPYLGFGDPARITPAIIASLGNRGIFKRCSANIENIGRGLEALAPISPIELQAGLKALGGAGLGAGELVTEAAFSDAAVDVQNKAVPAPFQQFQVVHFATHGLKENELGCDSPPALVTSTDADPNSDGLLSFEEIAALKLDANLVILSACNTAAETSSKRAREMGFRVGEAGAGATLNGLVRAFFNANSRAVLTTHWAIPNDVKTRSGGTLAPSTMMMESLFASARSNTIAGSVRAAQAAVRAIPDLSHPYYWGAFTVVGDGSKTMLSPTPGAIANARP